MIPFLGMLGLARRAGKLAFGDELVREACTDKKARCVFVAADAGMSTAKKAAFYAESANVPLVTLPHGKDALGAAIGKNGCAVCAVTDIGLAAAALQKLAAAHGEYAHVAAQVAEKNTRIQSRRGKKKPRDKAAAARSAPQDSTRPAQCSTAGGRPTPCRARRSPQGGGQKPSGPPHRGKGQAGFRRSRGRRGPRIHPANQTTTRAQSAHQNRQPPQSGVCHQNRTHGSRF